MPSRAASGSFGELAAQMVQVRVAYARTLAIAMSLSVVATEDCPRLTPEAIERDTRGSFLGGAALASFRAACDAWPRGRVERGFFDAVRSDVPTLLVSGRLDPATPPEWGEEVARDLTHRLHAVFPNAAHPNSGFTGLDQLVRAFVESGTVEGLDLSQAGKGELPPIVLPPIVLPPR